MEYAEYLDGVMETFRGLEFTEIERTTAVYEEIFRWEWIATKLKISSFITYRESVSQLRIHEYTDYWFRHAELHRRGLPRGFQNGDLVYPVLASHDLEPGAIAWVNERPHKHYSAFEYPVLVDLNTGQVHYYQGTMVWGMVYTSFFKSYIHQHFAPGFGAGPYNTNRI